MWPLLFEIILGQCDPGCEQCFCVLVTVFPCVCLQQLPHGRAGWFPSSQVLGCVFEHSSIGFPTISGCFARARGQGHGVISRHSCEVCRESWKDWEKSEVEQGWTRESQPWWKASTVTASGGLEVGKTEEKVQHVASLSMQGTPSWRFSEWQKKWK